MKHQTRFPRLGTPLYRVTAWKRGLAAFVILAALLFSGCNIPFPSTGISDTGNPVVVANQAQAIYSASDCTGPTVTTVQGGVNLVDLGPANTTCEQIAYPTETGYTQNGYVPVYSIHRASNSVQCVYQPGCNLRAGPSTTTEVLYLLPFGQRAQGRGIASTGTIITDGSQYSWWEVIVPSTGQVADVYGTLVVAY
jgi:hypothetical protein